MGFLGQQHKLAFHSIPLLCQLNKLCLEQTCSKFWQLLPVVD